MGQSGPRILPQLVGVFMVPVITIGLGLVRAANSFITAESWVGVGVAIEFNG